MSLRQYVYQERRFHVALLLLKRNQYHDALDRFKDILAQDKRLFPDILIPLYKRLRLNYFNLNLRLLIAELYISSEFYKEAIHELEEAYEIDPNFTQTYFLLNKIYNKGIAAAKIQTIFEQAFQNKVYDSAILDLLPKIYLENDEKEKSITFYKTLIQAFPKAVSYYRNLAELYSIIQHYEEAAKMYLTISELVPESASEISKKCETLVQYSTQNLFIRKTCITLYLKDCNLNKALFHVREMLSQIPNSEKDAVQIYKLGLESFPGNPDIILDLAKVLIQLEEYSEAISYLKRIITMNNTSYKPVKELLNSVLIRFPNQYLAIQVLIDIHKQEHDFTQALQYINQLLNIDDCDTQDLDHLRNELEAIIKADPELNLACNLAIAKVLLKQNRIQDCIQQCNDLNGTPFELKARFIHAQAKESEGCLLASKDMLIDILTQTPFEKTAHSQLSLLHQNLLAQGLNDDINPDEISFHSGLLYFRMGKLHQALECFQKIPREQTLYFDSQMMISRCFLEMGRFDLSINHTQRFLKKVETEDHNDANKLRYILSNNYLLRGDIHDALKELETILEFDVKFPYVYNLLERYKTYSFNNLRGRAVSACISHIESPLFMLCVQNKEDETSGSTTLQTMSFAHPHNDKGVDYMLKKNFTAAEDEFRLALQMDSNLTVVYCNYALALCMKSDYEQALAVLKTAEGLNPKLNLVYLNRGLIYARQGLWDNAANSFYKALQLNPENDLAKLNLGDAYFHKQDIKRAFEYWESVYTPTPLFHIILRRIDYLRAHDMTYHEWEKDLYQKTSALTLRKLNDARERTDAREPIDAKVPE
ncbi:tetratricopeptide repeat protein [Thermoproteota archaeon]